MTSNPAREALYNRLRDLLGEIDAATMMRLLPAEDPDQLATKTDIGRLGERIDRVDVRLDRLEVRVGSLETKVGSLETKVGSLEVKVDSLEVKVDRIQTTMDRFDDRLHDFHGALRDQTRNFVLASTASVVTVGGLAVAAAALI